MSRTWGICRGMPLPHTRRNDDDLQGHPVDEDGGIAPLLVAMSYFLLETAGVCVCVRVHLCLSLANVVKFLQEE